MVIAKTLFELCAETSQADVSRQLEIDKMRVSRLVRGATDIDSELVAACKALWGDAFDETRTLTEWSAQRLAFLEEQRRLERERLASEPAADAA